MAELSKPAKGRLTVVIFGASGDLTHRKLAPALFHLHRTGALPGMCAFVGVARSDMTDQQFRDHLAEEFGDMPAERRAAWESFAQKVSYVRGSSTEDEPLKTVDQHVSSLCAPGEADNRVYYLALGPSLYPETLRALGRTGLLKQDRGFRRVVIEKPFGIDLESARDLNEIVHSVADESQVFRIDHYLGKDTVQNLLIFRFANTIFEPVWNRNYVEQVQISVLESLDIEGRAAYYDRAGVLRDMFQSHLMQLMALVAMEPPATSGATALRNEKAKALQSVRRYSIEDAARNSVRGQYAGYRDERNVADTSSTATFGAVRLLVDNWRWQGVPFYLRSGKALKEKTSDIAIKFRPPPHTIFDTHGSDVTPNMLLVTIQPDEGVHLVFENKKPGSRMGTQAEELEYHFPPGVVRDAYERLLLDAIEGDQSLFTRSDEIELSWEIIDPFVEAWHSSLTSQLYSYQRGSEGPRASHEFIVPGGKWHTHIE
jgi:glucose-6-phosphate 1-dehydrogenase